MSAKRNESHRLWLDIEKIFFLTSVGSADENDLNKMRQLVLTAKKMKRDAGQMKKTISSLDEEVEVLIKNKKINFSTYILKKTGFD